MTTTFTQNEIDALKIIYANCLSGMGGETWEDLENDPYTWTDPSDLVGKGWSTREAGGTFASLIIKGAVSEYEEGQWVLELRPEVRAVVAA